MIRFSLNDDLKVYELLHAIIIRKWFIRELSLSRLGAGMKDLLEGCQIFSILFYLVPNKSFPKHNGVSKYLNKFLPKMLAFSKSMFASKNLFEIITKCSLFFDFFIFLLSLISRWHF